MKKNLFTLLIVCLAAFAVAQDQLFKRDNTKLEVKVLEVTPTEVKYKLFSNPDGPLYLINKNEIALIIYKNGAHETFPEVANTTAPGNTYSLEIPSGKKINIDSLLMRKNTIYYNFFELLNTAVAFSYWRDFANDLLSIHLPVSVSIGEPYAYNAFGGNYYGYGNNIYNYRITQKAIDASLGIYINSSPKKAITHFIGPSIRFLQYNGNYQTNFFQEPGNGYTYNPYGGYGSMPTLMIRRGFVLNETQLVINNGIIFRNSARLNIMVKLGVGMITRRYYVANDPSQYQDPAYANYNSANRGLTGNLAFNIGYKF